MQAGRDYMVIDTPFSASLPALNAGDLDAAAQVIGVPATPLRDALAQAKLQLLPLDPAAIKALSAGEDGVLMPIDTPPAPIRTNPTRWRQSARPPCC